MQREALNRYGLSSLFYYGRSTGTQDQARAYFFATVELARPELREAIALTRHTLVALSSSVAAIQHTVLAADRVFAMLERQHEEGGLGRSGAPSPGSFAMTKLEHMHREVALFIILTEERIDFLDHEVDEFVLFLLSALKAGHFTDSEITHIATSNLYTIRRRFYDYNW